MKIAVFEAEEREAAAFAQLKLQHELRLVPAALRRENVDDFADAEIVSTFIYSDLGDGVLQRLPALKLIATRSTGIDHIDVGMCARRGVSVSNVPHYGENTVAEHVFALLLAISHRLIAAVDRARGGHFSPEGLQGFDLAGKTLGVIATGGIGRHVVRIAKGFAMDVVAFDATPEPDLAQELGFRYAAIDVLYAESDVITLHVPSLPQTRHMLSGAAFDRMKDGAVIINTARGDLIDTRALIEGLTSGKIAAAGLDVLPDEPMIREEAELICSIFCDRHDLRNLVANHVLLRMPNVIVTPHSAFNSREAVDRIVQTTVENIAGFIAGAPTNVVAGDASP